MPALNADQVKAVVARFIPASLSDNVFVKALLAGAAAIAILLSTPAFAPVGVVGATGWIIVYVVTGGTLSFELIRGAWERWREMNQAQRDDIDQKLALLKKLRDDGVITEDEFKARAKTILDEAMGTAAHT